MFSARFRPYAIIFCLIMLSAYVRPAKVTAQCDTGIRITVLSINLRHGEKLNGKSNLSDVITLINRIEPDIALIQEVDRNVSRSSFRNQPRILAEGTGMIPAFTPTLPSYRGGEFGLLILSRKPYTDRGKHILPTKESGEVRLIQEARIEIQRDFSILVYHTHLGVDSPRQVRSGQIRSLKERFHGHRYDAVIVAGDLNITQQSWAHASLEETYRETAPADIPGTYPSHDPSVELDHIFFQTELPAEVVGFRIVKEPIVSDHLPIYAEIEFCLDSR